MGSFVGVLLLMMMMIFCGSAWVKVIYIRALSSGQVKTSPHLTLLHSLIAPIALLLFFLQTSCQVYINLPWL
jgi:hypothetical protein